MLNSAAEKINFLGLNFNNLNLDEAVDAVESFVKSKTPHLVFTTAAELIVRAQKEQLLKDVYNRSDLLMIDSYVGCYAARFLGNKIKEAVSAAKLTFRFFELKASKGYSFYILGAKDEILNNAVKNLRQKYPGINIVGYHNGYFDFEKDEKIVQDIKDKKPDILLAAMSSPLKESFINKNFSNINVPVYIGVGGTIDIVAGKCQLAPKWVSAIGLEWFFRFIQEPRRLWKRYVFTNAIFIGLVLKDLLKKILQVKSK
ncbi:MAG: WecB/TagA/CpsF family glycosyltransferase [bacterium]